MTDALLFDALSGFAWWVVLVSVPVLAFRHLCIWWFVGSPRTLHDARLAARFRGLILFGLDGAGFSFRSIGSPLTVRWTRRIAADGVSRLHVEVRCATLSEAELGRLLGRIGPLSGGHLDLIQSGADGFEVRVEGPLADDHEGLASVTRSIVSALGIECTEKFRFHSDGPRDERAIADHFRRVGRLSEGRSG